MIVTADELKVICAQAEEEYPNECCGVIMVRGEGRELLRFRNAQDEMHRIDSKRFPRTAQQAYYVGFDDYKRMEAFTARGFTVGIIYHSHPDTGAYFSPTDRDNAAPKPSVSPGEPDQAAQPRKREPIWPGVTYLVVSVMNKRAKEFGAFRWDPAIEDFIEIHKETVVSSEDVSA